MPLFAQQHTGLAGADSVPGTVLFACGSVCSVQHRHGHGWVRPMHQRALHCTATAPAGSGTATREHRLRASSFLCVQIRAELAEKELILLEKETELLEKDQTVLVLKEEVSGRGATLGCSGWLCIAAATWMSLACHLAVLWEHKHMRHVPTHRPSICHRTT